MKGIADTGFVVAYANRNDRHHDWAVGVAERVDPPLLTCEAVMAEAAFHLEDSSLVLELVEAGLLLPAFEAVGNLSQLLALARRYADRNPDLADLCLIRMSELHPKHMVVTVDRTDFRVYRKNKRESIPLVCPPEP